MKFRKDKNILRFFGMSLGMMVLGVIISFFIKPIFIGAGFVLGGLALLVTGFYMFTKPKEYFVPDERITKNTDKAGHHAFWLVLLVSCQHQNVCLESGITGCLDNIYGYIRTLTRH